MAKGVNVSSAAHTVEQPRPPRNADKRRAVLHGIDESAVLGDGD